MTVCDRREGTANCFPSMEAHAQTVANILDHGYAGNPFPDEDDIHTLLTFADISMEDFCGIGGRVVEEIDKAKVFLQI